MATIHSIEAGVAVGLGTFGAPELVLPTTRTNVIIGLVACAAAAKAAYEAWQGLRSTLPLE